MFSLEINRTKSFRNFSRFCSSNLQVFQLGVCHFKERKELFHVLPQLVRKKAGLPYQLLQHFIYAAYNPFCVTSQILLYKHDNLCFFRLHEYRLASIKQRNMAGSLLHNGAASVTTRGVLWARIAAVNSGYAAGSTVFITSLPKYSQSIPPLTCSNVFSFSSHASFDSMNISPSELPLPAEAGRSLTFRCTPLACGGPTTPGKNFDSSPRRFQIFHDELSFRDSSLCQLFPVDAFGAAFHAGLP